MNPFESKRVEKKLSEQELNKLQERAERCLDLVHSHPKSSISYRHLTGNLGVFIDIFLVMLEEKGKDHYLKSTVEEQKEFYINLTTCMDAMEKYFRLLKQYPKFAEKELACDYGQENRRSAAEVYFPEIFKMGGGSTKVIDAYEKALREEKTQ